MYENERERERAYHFLLSLYYYIYTYMKYVGVWSSSGRFTKPFNGLSKLSFFAQAGKNDFHSISSPLIVP